MDCVNSSLVWFLMDKTSECVKSVREFMFYKHSTVEVHTFLIEKRISTEVFDLFFPCCVPYPVLVCVSVTVWMYGSGVCCFGK